MKRASSGPDDSKPRKGGIKWDEDNLEENERIKKELNPRKIDEPKTPYLSPQATEDEAEILEDGVSPLSLNDNDTRDSGHGAVRIHKSPWSDSSDQNGGSPSPRASNGNSNGGVGDRSWSRSPRFSEEYYRDNSDDEDDEDEDDDGEEELANGEAGVVSRKMKKIEKRKKFQEARKAHYGMKEALQKAKELLEKEIENSEIENDDDATWGYSGPSCSIPTHPGGGGFPLPAGKSKTFSVPDDWCSGRIWARTGCQYSSEVFVGDCDTGDCGQGYSCSTTGQAPATLAEFTLNSKKNDYYDLSLVDGFNVGIEIKPVKGKKVPGVPAKYNCGTARCGTPAFRFKMSLCPKELRTRNNRYCMSICQAVSRKNTQDVAYIANFDEAQVCCSCDCGPNCGCNDGKNDSCKYGCSPYHPTQPPFDYNWKSVCDANEWPKSSLKGISYPEVFKKQCPDAYSWQFDDLSSTYQCTRPNYVITMY